MNARPQSDLAALLNSAKKSPGWNGRFAPPQSVSLDGGCQLVVLVPTLWRGRCRPRPAGCCLAAVPLRPHPKRRAVGGRP